MFGPGHKTIGAGGNVRAMARAKTFDKMRRERTVDGVKSSETVYTSVVRRKMKPRTMPHAYVNIGGIENKLHWHLDVTFRKDQCRASTEKGAVNLSAMRKHALELLKR